MNNTKRNIKTYLLKPLREALRGFGICLLGYISFGLLLTWMMLKLMLFPIALIYIISTARHDWFADDIAEGIIEYIEWGMY